MLIRATLALLHKLGTPLQWWLQGAAVQTATRIYVHAKSIIVDDGGASIGSANANQQTKPKANRFSGDSNMFIPDAFTEPGDVPAEGDGRADTRVA